MTDFLQRELLEALTTAISRHTASVISTLSKSFIFKSFGFTDWQLFSSDIDYTTTPIKISLLLQTIPGYIKFLSNILNNSWSF